MLAILTFVWQFRSLGPTEMGTTLWGLGESASYKRKKQGKTLINITIFKVAEKGVLAS